MKQLANCYLGPSAKPNPNGPMFPKEREDKGMLNILKSEANKTYTENGAVTLSTTGSDCLDFLHAQVR